MLAPEQTVAEFALPALDLRGLARRAVLPALLVLAGVAFAVLAGGRIHAFAEILRRMLDANPGWAAAGIVFEAVSVAGYVWLLSLVGGRATPRIGAAQSAQITLAGTAATRLLPTAGAGGAALTLWALRRAGLAPAAAARTLLAFLVLLYSVFLASLALAGLTLAFGVGAHHGPTAVSAIASAAALASIVVALVLACTHSPAASAEPPAGRLAGGARLIGHAVADALAFVRSRDSRLAGAIAYWAFDAAVLWSMLHAFGAPPAVPVIALAYFVGQVANTLPIPGSVSGGMAGMLIAFGVAPALALPAVLAYRTVAVWLPTPAAAVAIPGLRATVTRWGREDTAAAR